MADITTRTFGQIVTSQAAAIQARAAGLVDVTIGSICRSIIEAVATVALWLQSNIMALLATTRLSTSAGADVDTWIADWGAAPMPGDPTLFARLPAVAATGTVTFSRFTSSGTATIPVGSTVSSADGSVTFAVTLDTSNPAYDAISDGYVMANAVTSLNLPVACTTASSAGNAAIGAINTITTAIPGVDTVTNAAAFTNGADAETDDQVKTRFQAYIQALRRGTPEALKTVVENLQRGVTAVVVENEQQNGTQELGFVYLVVDDGTGTPPQSILDAASAAVQEAHAAGIRFAVYAPVVVSCNVVMAVTKASGADATLVQTAVSTAIKNYLNGLAGGTAVFLTRIYQVAYDASPDISEVTSLTLNGGTSDVAVTINQVAKAGTVTVTVT